MIEVFMYGGLWWLSGIMLVQWYFYVLKYGYFSKTKNWTLEDMANELVLALFGPILIILWALSCSDGIVVKHAKGTKKK